MSRLEFGVMLELLLTDKESVKVFSEDVGKTITALEISNNKLCFTFSDTSKMDLFDDGQSCCENRYMNTNDDLDSFIGSNLQSAAVHDVFRKEDKYEVIDSAFLVVSTSTGQFTVIIHNEHNGHYEGFLIKAERI